MKKTTMEKRRKEIFEAALKVFSDKGFDKTTLEDVADKVGLSKPAIYLYFKNKEDLFFSMIYDRIKDIEDKLKEIVKMQTQAIKKIESLIVFKTKFFKENLNFFKILHEMEFEIINLKSAPKFKKKFSNKYKKYINKISNIMQQCIDEGYLKNDDKYFYTFSLLGLINQNIFRFIILDNNDFSENLSKKIYNQFLEGAKK